MIIVAKNHRQVVLRSFNSDDLENLFDYLQGLSAKTKKLFGPHPFDKQSIIDLYKNPNQYLGYIAEVMDTKKVVAYSIIKIGYLQHDSFRLQSYGLKLDKNKDCTFAPSVADLWQIYGIGNAMFNFIYSDIKTKGIKRIILWGGVQSNNERAINYYNKNGFRVLGQFENNGQNYDMILENI